MSKNEDHTPSLISSDRELTADMLYTQHHGDVQMPTVGSTYDNMVQHQTIIEVELDEPADYFTNLYGAGFNSGQSGEYQYHMQHQSQTEETISQFRKPPPEKFIHEGFVYNFNSFTKNKKRKIWICCKRAQGCNCRIHTDVNTNMVVFQSKKNHTHDKNPKDVELTRLRAIVKVRALQCNDKAAQVVKDSLKERPNLKDQLSKAEKYNLAKIVYRERSLADYTVPIAKPCITEEENTSGYETEEMELEAQHVPSLLHISVYQEQDKRDKVINSHHSSNNQAHHSNNNGVQPTLNNPHGVQEAVVEFDGELSDEDMMSLEQSSDTC